MHLWCQVSNWFINARVRLWKPMIEEMYAELNQKKSDEGLELDGESLSNANSWFRMTWLSSSLFICYCFLALANINWTCFTSLINVFISLPYSGEIAVLSVYRNEASRNVFPFSWNRKKKDYENVNVKVIIIQDQD